LRCPACQRDVTPKPIGFTWWGGVLGSKLLHHVECPSCHARFNGISGRSNNTAIGIYLAAAGIIAVLAGYLLTRAH
jgi:hypothetical protein